MTGKNERFEKSIEYALSYLRTKEYVKKVYLYGSYSRGKYKGLSSDVDIFVIVEDGFNNPDVIRDLKINANPIDCNLPEVDIHISDVDLENKRSNTNRIFIQNIRKDAKLLWKC
ncbi:MAG: nucleotidyltransferase domain-containing protein [Lachnospiraceae bacterium]|nr:nucleotidyltransferase domain-containing protein [Lachnospiraceae bacterium]